MNSINKTQREVVNALLEAEHINYAIKLGLINRNPVTLERPALAQAVSLIDKLSRSNQEFAKRVSVLAIALTWEYANGDYRDSLREIFITMLSRMGIAPATILIDEEFKSSGKYSPFSSYINKISILANQISHEVTLNNQIYLLTEFQKEVWDSIDKNKITCISAPTSAGKSFIIYLKIIERLARKKARIIYIVPTISLVAQVTRDLTNLIKEFSLEGIEVYTGIQESPPKCYIYVLTQERAISGFNETNHFNEIDLLVVDEIQNIERVASDGDQRSKILYDFLKEIKHQTKTEKIILSGPRLKNIGNLGYEIFDEVSYEAETKLPPVVNVTYSIAKTGRTYLLNQYSDISEQPRAIKIENSSNISGLGGTLYNEGFHSYLISILSKVDKDKSNLIFSPTAIQARKTANYLADHKVPAKDPKLESLSKYIEYFVHPDYDLAKIVKCGVAYHTGKLPLHIRSVIEESFAKGSIKNIVCTTTLMQGVNFPASTILVRNPYLFVKRKSNSENVKLSNYEFSNLRGRAGRLLKEFIGRTIVLDESSFEVESNQESLFEQTEKELTAGYGEYFDRFRSEIEEGIKNQQPIDEGKEKSLLTHIRQTVFRHGNNSLARLEEVGINLDKEKISKIIESLARIEVPKEVVLKNRYWDPLDLEIIFQALKSRKLKPLPRNIWDQNLLDSLKNSLATFSEIMPYYFKRYIGDPNGDAEMRSRYIWSICRYATDWGRENLLREILSERNFTENSSDEIDKAVQTISSKACFGLPMLLKPLADMSPEDNAVLSIIENGAHHKITKFLISKGVPRDTAIYLKNKHLSMFDKDNLDFREVQIYLSELRKNISPWISIQIESACLY